jgi:hypothetical protein
VRARVPSARLIGVPAGLDGLDGLGDEWSTYVYLYCLYLVAVGALSTESKDGKDTTLFVSVLALIGLGYAGARAGGAAPLRPMLRVVGGGIVAMAATMAIGKLFGAAVG